MQKIRLYSFRRCPYAIRARMALIYSKCDFDLIEVNLKEKPKEMLSVSPKGTVPVLLLSDGSVIDESLDIMFWALGQNDPNCWLGRNQDEKDRMRRLVIYNDSIFKQNLDRYKYPSRYDEVFSEHPRVQCLNFLKDLDQLLSLNQYLFRPSLSYADVAIFPFVRQCYKVDEKWFESTDTKYLLRWLKSFLDSELFNCAMKS